MLKQTSSPERPTVKVTYLDRQKKVRPSKIHKDHSTSDSDSKETIAMRKASSPSKNEKSDTIFKAPESKDMKRIDFRLPGPSPKRTIHDSEITQESQISTPVRAKKGKHARSSSSISSLSRVAQQFANSSKQVKPLSKTRSGTPETELDDGVSIADSIAESTVSVTRTRRNEGERLQYFENQTECGRIEPYRALCTRCNKYVSLGKKQAYTVRPWENHRSRCDQKPSFGESHLVEDSVAHEDDDKAPPVSYPASPSMGRVGYTAEEKKAMLEADEQVEIVEPSQVKCSKCQKWICLSTQNQYDLHHWKKHRELCSDAVPSSRVATAERKLRIVNDPNANSFGPRNVECGNCNTNVILIGQGDYNLDSWEEHKALCLTNNANISSVPFPSNAEQPSISAASIERTLLARKGIKRMREEDETNDPDARPAIRQRSEVYTPPEQTPSPLGWFLLPIKAFVRGFRESLRNDSEQ